MDSFQVVLRLPAYLQQCDTASYLQTTWLSKQEGNAGVWQRGAVFQAAGVQHPRATLQGAPLTGTESSKVSPMHHPNGTGIFQVLQAQCITQTLNSRLAVVTRELSWGPVSGHSDCSVGKHHKHALIKKGILNRAKNIEDEPKK